MNLTTLLTTAPTLTAGRPLNITGAAWRIVLEAALPAPAAALWGSAQWGNDRWSDPGAGALAWVDLTGRLRGWDVERGADTPSDPPAVTVCTVTLDNVDGRLAPWTQNPATGAGHAGRYAAGTIVRLSLLRSGTWLPLFTGEVESWNPQFIELHADGWVTITVVDLLARLATFTTPAVTFARTGETCLSRLAHLLESAEFPTGLDSDAVQRGYPLNGTTLEEARLSELQRTAASDGLNLFASRKGLVTTRPALVSLTDPNAGPARRTKFGFVDGPRYVLGGTFNDSPTAEMTAAGYDLEIPFDPRTLSITGDRTDIINVANIDHVTGTATARDTASTSWHGPHEETRTDLLCYTADPAQSLAAALVRAKGWPRPTVTVDVHYAAGNDDYAGDAGLLAIALHDLGDRLDIWWKDPDGHRVRIPGNVLAYHHAGTVVAAGALEVTATYTLAAHLLTTGPTAGYA